jgi:hypothetical protein
MALPIPFDRKALSRHAPLTVGDAMMQTSQQRRTNGFLPDSPQPRHDERLRQRRSSASASMALVLRLLASLRDFSVSHGLGSYGAFNGNAGGAAGLANPVAA